MDILDRARRLESKIAGSLDKYAKDIVRSGAREPLEIVHAIVDAIAQQIQPGGRGTRIFPFNRIDVAIAAAARDARARLEAVCEGEPPLGARIVERLRSEGCSASGLVVSLAYVACAQKHWRDPQFHLECARVASPPPAQAVEPDVTPGHLEVTVVRGVAEPSTYSFAAARIELGRGVEVRDSRNRLIRTNHVAFTEGAGDVNQSVSRQHAHIVHEPGSGQYRLHDDGSGQGTGIVRNGRTVSVPRGSRGVRLQSGDEIALGEARLRISYDFPRARSTST